MIVSDDDPWVQMQEAKKISSHYNTTFTTLHRMLDISMQTVVMENGNLSKN